MKNSGTIKKAMDLKSYNLTSKLLTGLIFNQNALPTLSEFGLKNVYIDDYGYKCKYDNCLFFLFNITKNFYDPFENKIVKFESFYDWYDVDDFRRMLVYKVGDVYKEDLFKYKSNVHKDYSIEFIEAVSPNASSLLENYKLDYSKEIFRYNLEGSI